MSLLVERFGNYSFVQALGASFKEVQKNPPAIRGTLKGINGVIYTLGLCIVLGPAAHALTSGLRIADRTLKVYMATSKIDLWANYTFNFKEAAREDYLKLAKDIGATVCYTLAAPQLLYDMKVLDGKFPKPIAIGTDVIDLLIAFYDLHTLIPKAFEYRTDKPLTRCANRIQIWSDILDKLKAKDKSVYNDIKLKSLKVEKLDEVVLEAALITHAHDKKIKWEKKKEELPIRQKSNLYQIAFNVSLAALMVFLIAGALTGLSAIYACATLTGLTVSYFGLYSFLYDAFNPEVNRVLFNHSAPAA